MKNNKIIIDKIKSIIYNYGLEFYNIEELYSRDNIRVVDKLRCVIINDNIHKPYNGFLGGNIEVSLNRLENGSPDRPVSKTNRFSIYNINKYIDNNHISCKLLSKDYKEKSEKMEFSCECGNTFLTSWNTFNSSNKHLCSDCSKERSSMLKKDKSFNKGGSFKTYLINNYDSEWVKIWDFDKNSVDPNEIGKNSTNEVYLNCIHEEYHHFKIKCCNYVAHKKCAYCIGKKVNIKDSFGYRFPEYMDLWSDKNNVSPYEVFYNTSIKFWFKCPNGRHEDSFKQINSGITRSFSCLECAYENNRGGNNSNWKGGISTINSFLRSSIEDWKKETLNTYSYRCDITGKLGDFEIHHLTGFATIVKDFITDFNIDIREGIGCYSQDELDFIKGKFVEYHRRFGLGVLINKQLHDEFHKIYGKNNGDNTPEQYYEFKNNYIQDNKNIVA